jgi:hypothetical protein
VVGTVARCFWYPFTFTKGKLSATIGADQHNRIEIKMKEAKDVFYKTLKWAGAKIRATCYRTGTDEFPPKLTFFKHVAEVRDSPKFFKILAIEMKNYSHHHKNGNVFNQSSMDIDLFNTKLLDEI